MFKLIATSAALALATCSAAHAGVIVSAESAEILSGDPGAGDIQSTYDLLGLLDDYTSGETDFDAYLASNPLHVWDFSVLEGPTTYFYEWFANPGATSAVVSYDLGSIQQTQGLALWNEDGNGIGELNILGSIDGQTWTLLGSQLTPTNNPTRQDYGADVFSWGTTSARYIKLEMSKCPASVAWNGCSIGEVAFNVSAVPEVGSLSMFGIGLAMLGIAAARRRSA